MSFFTPMTLNKRWMLPLLLVAFFWGQAMADEGGVALSATRIVFTDTDRAKTITISNHGQSVYLVQAGVVMSQENAKSAPFVVTPPLFRLESLSQNTLRILPNGTEVLPRDRESVFYFAATAIPASSRPSEQTQPLAASVSIGLRTLIKLFYRPSGLNITPEEAATNLTFSWRGGRLNVSNPTPYYLTLSTLSLDGKSVDLRTLGAMLAPKSEWHYPISGPVHQAQWAVINDYGGMGPVNQAQVNVGGGPA